MRAVLVLMAPFRGRTGCDMRGFDQETVEDLYRRGWVRSNVALRGGYGASLTQAGRAALRKALADPRASSA